VAEIALVLTLCASEASPQRGGAATQRGTAMLAVRTGGTPVPRNLHGKIKIAPLLRSKQLAYHAAADLSRPHQFQ